MRWLQNERLRQRWVWLKRCRYCRGFGIQSPTDYAFVRYVINQHNTYYAYEEFEGMGLTPILLKKGKLLFRLVNYWQPSAVYVHALSTDFTPFIMAAKRGVAVKPLSERTKGERLVLLTNAAEMDNDLMALLLAEGDEQMMWVVEDIHKNTSNRRRWKKLVKAQQTVLTYDLYDVGIVFFYQRRVKQHYLINF